MDTSASWASPDGSDIVGDVRKASEVFKAHQGLQTPNPLEQLVCLRQALLEERCFNTSVVFHSDMVEVALPAGTYEIDDVLTRVSERIRKAYLGS